MLGVSEFYWHWGLAPLMEASPMIFLVYYTASLGVTGNKQILFVLSSRIVFV